MTVGLPLRQGRIRRSIEKNADDHQIGPRKRLACRVVTGMKLLPPHPFPAADFAKRDVPILSSQRNWYRVHPIDKEPLYFGQSTNNRFDAPDGAFRTTYVAQTPSIAFLETHGHATGIQFIEAATLASRGLAQVTSCRPLRLVDLAGSGLARLGADGRLASGDSYEHSQAWASAIFNHPANVDGIIYRARHDQRGICAAIFERAAPALDRQLLGPWSAPQLRGILGKILDTYGFGLI